MRFFNLDCVSSHAGPKTLFDIGSDTIPSLDFFSINYEHRSELSSNELRPSLGKPKFPTPTH